MNFFDKLIYQKKIKIVISLQRVVLLLFKYNCDLVFRQDIYLLHLAQVFSSQGNLQQQESSFTDQQSARIHSNIHSHHHHQNQGPNLLAFLQPLVFYFYIQQFSFYFFLILFPTFSFLLIFATFLFLLSFTILFVLITS